MQGGRLLVDAKQSAKPRGGQARFVFDGTGPALLLTEQGTEREPACGACDRDAALTSPPLDRLGPEADRRSSPTSWLRPLHASESMRLHGFLRDQRAIAGIGRRLANEVCHRAKLSPFAMTGKLAADGADRGRRRRSARPSPRDWSTSATRDDMSSSKDRPGRGARANRRGLPGVRRHDPRRRVLGLHRELLPDVPDRRQGARRQHDEQVPQVASAAGGALPGRGGDARRRGGGSSRQPGAATPTSGRCRSSAARSR